MRQSNLTEGLSFVLRQLSQGGGGKKLTERVRAEWREKYDPEGVLSVEELRQKARDEFTDQARAQLAREGEDVSVMDVQNVMEKMQQRNREMQEEKAAQQWIKEKAAPQWIKEKAAQQKTNSRKHQ